MIIEEKIIPNKLSFLLSTNNWIPPSKETLSKFFLREVRNPSFYDKEQILFENEGLKRQYYEYKFEDILGTNGLGIGTINLKKLLMIGDINIDEPFALYYYNEKDPIIIFYDELNDEPFWRKVADSFDAFWETINFLEKAVPPQKPTD